jgi:transposase InsO family protein
MDFHKNCKLVPSDRRWIWRLYNEGKSVSYLAEFFNVSRPTIYKVLERARLREFMPRKSVNKKYRLSKYGVRRLAKVEALIEAKLRKKAKLYCKRYPGEMVHFDTKRLPLLKGEKKSDEREYLFVAIDDYSRELFANIYTSKNQICSARFLRQVIEESPYTIECAYSDNGTEYKGTKDHDFVACAKNNNINQKFTQVRRPQTNGKAERVIKTLMEGWHHERFKNRDDRKTQLYRFINYYNAVKPHRSLNNSTPYECLMTYFDKE